MTQILNHSQDRLHGTSGVLPCITVAALVGVPLFFEFFDLSGWHCQAIKFHVAVAAVAYDNLSDENASDAQSLNSVGVVGGYSAPKLCC